MGKQKYTAKEKKVSRMTRNGLVEENLATKETRKVTNSDQELSYKQQRLAEEHLQEAADIGRISGISLEKLIELLTIFYQEED